VRLDILLFERYHASVRRQGALRVLSEAIVHHLVDIGGGAVEQPRTNDRSAIRNRIARIKAS
jgi:hypothetical protein